MLKTQVFKLLKIILSPNLMILFKEINFRLFGILGLNIQDSNVISKKDLESYFKERDIIEKIRCLTLHTDTKSKIVVENVLGRILNNVNFINKNNLSKIEVRDFKIIFGPYLFENYKNVYIEKNLYKFMYPGFTNFSLNCFKFHHGLKLFDNKLAEYLEGGDCIDGGSYILDSAVVLQKNYNLNKIISFEIDELNFKEGLKIKNEHYKDLNIVSLNLGLWDKEDSLYIDDLKGEASKISLDHDKHTKKVKFINIDKVVDEYNLNLKLIKLDVEGAEYKTILGAKKTIQENTPVLSVSVYHNPKDFFEIKPLIESIAPNSYDFYIRKLAPCYSPHETCLLAVPKSINTKINDMEKIEIYG